MYPHSSPAFLPPRRSPSSAIQSKHAFSCQAQKVNGQPNCQLCQTHLSFLSLCTLVRDQNWPDKQVPRRNSATPSPPARPSLRIKPDQPLTARSDKECTQCQSTFPPVPIAAGPPAPPPAVATLRSTPSMTPAPPSNKGVTKIHDGRTMVSYENTSTMRARLKVRKMPMTIGAAV